MATASVTYTFSPNTLVKSSEANTNFSDVVSFLNGSVVHKDGTIAFTGVPSGPASDPVSDNQYSRKAYVDKRTGIAVCTRTATIGDSGSYQSLTSLWTLSLNNPSSIASLPDDLQINTAGWYLVGGIFQVAVPSGSGINGVIRCLRIKLAGNVVAQSPPQVGTNTFADQQGPHIQVPLNITAGQKLAMDVYQQNAASGALAYTAKLWAMMLVPS